MDVFRLLKRLAIIAIIVIPLALSGCGDDGDDGRNGIDGVDGVDGVDGSDGLPGTAIVDASTASDDILAGLDIESEVTGVTIASPPVVDFTVTTADGRPVIGIADLWEDSSRFVRFTITKLVPGTNGDPDTWVAYTRDTVGDGTTSPDYDTGSSLVDNGDGSYTFTFNTDVAAVTGVDYDATLTHRVAGQIGGGSELEPQNLAYDFVPAGGEVTNMKNVAVMESCNECHDDLVFHGRRFLVEYCVQCHNPDLAEGEGDMAFMTHKIHAAGTFDVLDDAIDYSEVTYPQELANCRKCHNGADEATAQGDNWKTVPHKSACLGCHDVAATEHPANIADNSGCADCHSAASIEEYHLTANATENNPDLFAGQREIVYELVSVTADAGGVATIEFTITSDGTPLDLTALPADLAGPGRYPGFLLSYAMPQSGITAPADYNNFGQSAGQPISVGIDAADTLTCTEGVCTAVLTSNPFPADATMRAVGLQGYFQQDIGADTVSLHTQSAVMPVAGDAVRREVVDSAKCAACHEIFEGHGGNRNFTANGGVAICTQCHVPNLSSSGRTLDLSYPEDTQNFKDMIHGIHASAVRTTAYEHVRNFRDAARFYDWSEVTFPAEVGNCALCHLDGAIELPLDENILETTVRTVNTTVADYAAARDAVPNDEDWVNSPVASSCFYCHDSEAAGIHMEQNGATLSVANPGVMVDTARSEFVTEAAESCVICHGEGKIADVSVVHGQ